MKNIKDNANNGDLTFDNLASEGLAENNLARYDANNPYQPRLSRRESLKWLGSLSLGVLSVGAISPTLMGCDTGKVAGNGSASSLNGQGQGHWRDLNLSSLNGQGYGKDPNLIIPPKSPWPKTLSAEQLTLIAVLSDILVPREGDVPAASEVNVPDVIDEWMSAPYERQQADRLTILSLLSWLDVETTMLFKKLFVECSPDQQLSVIDNIAFEKADLAEQFVDANRAFSRFRKLVLAAFFCSPQGTKDLGYQGNVAITGDYPGPTDEAMAHLHKVLADLGLTL